MSLDLLLQELPDGSGTPSFGARGGAQQGLRGAGRFEELSSLHGRGWTPFPTGDTPPAMAHLEEDRLSVPPQPLSAVGFWGTRVQGIISAHCHFLFVSFRNIGDVNWEGSLLFMKCSLQPFTAISQSTRRWSGILPFVNEACPALRGQRAMARSSSLKVDLFKIEQKGVVLFCVIYSIPSRFNWPLKI